jgi:hypothetical protein
MENALSTYLADHLAGSVHAIELAKNLKEESHDEKFTETISLLLSDIETDRETLKGLANSVGTDASKMKELTAWLGEKVSRLKLGDARSNLGTLERLEVLEIGIYGKRALWRALSAIAPTDRRLQGFDFHLLSNRAQDQLSIVEDLRLQAARKALDQIIDDARATSAT